MTASGSFEDFIEQFKKRHAADFTGIAGKSANYQESREKYRSPSHSPNRLVNATQKAESVRLAGVPDRQCQAAGDDWDGAEEYGDFTEGVE